MMLLVIFLDDIRAIKLLEKKLKFNIFDANDKFSESLNDLKAIFSL